MNTQIWQETQKYNIFISKSPRECFHLLPFLAILSSCIAFMNDRSLVTLAIKTQPQIRRNKHTKHVHISKQYRSIQAIHLDLSLKWSPPPRLPSPLTHPCRSVVPDITHHRQLRVRCLVRPQYTRSSASFAHLRSSAGEDWAGTRRRTRTYERPFRTCLIRLGPHAAIGSFCRMVLACTRLASMRRLPTEGPSTTTLPLPTPCLLCSYHKLALAPPLLRLKRQIRLKWTATEDLEMETM